MTRSDRKYSKSGKKLKNKEAELFNHLLLNPNFTSEVKQFRDAHGIPPNGFKTDQDYWEWHKKHQFIHKNIVVTKEIITLDTNNQPVISSKVQVNEQINTYYLDLCKILDKHDLSLEWLPFVNSLISFNKRGKISVFEVNLDRSICDGVVIRENLNFKFGATMNIKRIFEDPSGINIWTEDIRPLQQLMQGYSEKSKRPSRSKTELQAKIYNMTQAGADDEEIWEKLMDLDSNIQTVRQHRKRFKDKIKRKS